MFDFEKWSEKVLRVVELKENAKINEATALQEFNKLWNELNQQQDDHQVRFLLEFLTHIRENMHGNVSEQQIYSFLQQKRNEVLL